MTAMGKTSRMKKTPRVEVRTGKGKSPEAPAPSRDFPTAGMGPETASRKTLFPMLAVISAASFAVYLNTLSNGFVYDDNLQVLRNPWIREVKHLPGIFYQSVWNFQATATINNYYRPLMHLIFMANYHLFGLTPWGFHLVNVLFHVGNSVLLFLLAARLFGNPAGRPEGRNGGTWRFSSPPFLAALLFATHPIHTEAVAWVGAVTDLSFTFFYMLSLYFHIGSGADTSNNSRFFSVASFAIALLCKEPAATLPFLLIAYDAAFRRPSLSHRGKDDPSSLSPPVKGEWMGNYLNRYVPYFAVLAAYFVARSYALGGFSPVKSHADLGTYGYVINVFPLFAQHIGKLLLPIKLNAFHVLHPVRSLVEFKGIVGLVVVAAFAAATVVAFRKSRIAFIGLVLVVVPLLPALYIPALGESVFAERYLYLPSVGFVILLAASFAWVREKMPRTGLAITVFAVSLALLYSVQTVRRNPVWKDDLTLFSDTVRKSPDGELPNGMLGIALMDAGRFDEAIGQFRKTIKLNPDSANAYYNLGLTFVKKGLPEEAIPEFEKALTLTPNDPDARRYLAKSYLSVGKTEKTIEQFRILLASKGASPEAYLDFGVALRQQGKTNEAVESYQKALAMDPEYAEAHFNLGNAYADSGQMEKAIEEYEAAVRLQPGNAYFRNMLGITYGQKGMYDKAVEQFEAAVKLAPSEPAYRRNLDRAAGLKDSAGKTLRSPGMQQRK